MSKLNGNSTSGKEVMRQRRLHDLNGGLVFVDRRLGHNFMLTLATGYKDFSAHKFYLNNNVAIKKVFNDLKQIISLSDIKFMEEPT
jgi:hypothetical protein